MKNDAINAQWKEFRSQTRQWWHIRSSAQPIKVDRNREKFIEILQKRYGYTEEKAAAELDTHYSKARLS